MAQFATEGAVDETLTFINSTLQVLGEGGRLEAPIEGSITWMNKYSNENDRYIFFAEDVGRYVTSGRNLYQYTDAGTPRLVITQNNDVTARVIVFDGDYKGHNGTVTVNKKTLWITPFTPWRGSRRTEPCPSGCERQEWKAADSLSKV